MKGLVFIISLLLLPCFFTTLAQDLAVNPFWTLLIIGFYYGSMITAFGAFLGADWQTLGFNISLLITLIVALLVFTGGCRLIRYVKDEGKSAAK
ncbi:MAG: hypothetical protein FWD32_00080 [Firmicutes bacterium]|nr:hypothetical protein [Bacillota bacterium]